MVHLIWYTWFHGNMIFDLEGIPGKTELRQIKEVEEVKWYM